MQALDNEIVSPRVHANEDRIHEIFSHLRDNEPVRRTTPEGYRPFWSLTKYKDIMEVSRANDVFINSRRLNLMTCEQEAVAKAATGEYARIYRTMTHMDNPEHREYRKVTRDWFMGPSVRELDGQVTAIANHFIDRIAEREGETFDFAREIANLYPLRVIMSILGVPEADEPLLLRLTQEFFGGEDPDLRRRDSDRPTSFGSLAEIFDYFTAMATDRRANPRDDLATVIANGRVFGEPMGDLETVSYYAITATAGHDTTAASTAGGMLALMQRPDDYRRLRDNRQDPELLRKAIEEMIRWVSPVKHFMRTANRDYRLGEVLIEEGQSIAMFYPSANRDEEQFADPFKFDLERTPNRHLSFGFGGHMCLGLMLARLEMNVFFREFLRRVESIELDGEVRRIQANLVGGFKAMPVRVRMAA